MDRYLLSVLAGFCAGLIAMVCLLTGIDALQRLMAARAERRNALQRAANILSDGNIQSLKSYYTDEAIREAMRMASPASTDKKREG
jgi:hypothetical protein